MSAQANPSHVIRKFDRFELKYFVPLKTAFEFRQSLRAFLTPDDHGDARGRYVLASLYYDGPDFRFYHEKLDGINIRRKLRIRRYESREPLTAGNLVFVEIKQRVNRVTQKRRVVLPYRDALRLCNERVVPAHAPHDAGVLNEIEWMLWQYNLRPASIVRYTRQAFISPKYDLGLRVTFDTDLTFQVRHLRLDEHPAGLPLFPNGWAIIEIKVNERMPYWLTELVAAHNLNLVRVSKYCRSIELAQNLTTPGWRFPPIG